MRVATSREAESLTELAQRLYGATSRRDLRRARASLKEANPRLSTRGRIPPDTVVAVPDVEGLETSADARHPIRTASSLIREAQADIKDLGPYLQSLLDKREEAAKAGLSLLRSAKLRKLARESPEVAERLPGLAEKARERVQQVKSMRKVGRDVVSEVEAGLSELLETSGGSDS